MPQKIEAIGVYRGLVKESGLGATKQGKPQWVARLSVTEKWVDSPEELEAFQITEPAWVDFTSYDLETEAFLMLFNATDEFIPEGDGANATLNYQQLKLLGWDGAEFDTLANLVGTKLLFRMEENTYNRDNGEEVTTVRPNWIDAYDASPIRQLKTLDADKVKAFSAKIKVAKAPPKAAGVTKPAAPAKPVTPAAKPVTPPAKPAGGPPKTAPKAPAAPAAPATPTLASGDQGAAWAFLCDNANGHLAEAIEKTWITVATEVAAGRDESALTEADWGTIATKAVAALAAAKA